MHEVGRNCLAPALHTQKSKKKVVKYFPFNGHGSAIVLGFSFQFKVIRSLLNFGHCHEQ